MWCYITKDDIRTRDKTGDTDRVPFEALTLWESVKDDEPSGLFLPGPSPGAPSPKPAPGRSGQNQGSADRHWYEGRTKSYSQICKFKFNWCNRFIWSSYMSELLFIINMKQFFNPANVTILFQQCYLLLHLYVQNMHDIILSPPNSRGSLYRWTWRNNLDVIVTLHLHGSHAQVKSVTGTRGVEHLFNLFQMSHMEAFTLIAALWSCSAVK